MILEVTNKLTISCSNDEWVELEPKLLPYIIVDNQAYIRMMNLGFSVQNELEQFALAEQTYHNGMHTLILPIGLLDYIKHLFPKEYLRYTQGNPQVSFQEIIKYKHLYPYQRSAVNNMLPFRNGILESDTGSGKTMMGLALALLKGNSFLWINDRIELCKQARNTAIKFYHLPEVDCGLLQGDNENIKKYTFTTIQKLHKVLNTGFNDITQKLIHFDTIIIDECHHCIGSYNDYKQYFQAINELDYKFVYGLTATPKRVDGNESLVYAIIGPVRFRVTEQTKTMKATIINKTLPIETSKELYESFLNKYTGKAIPSKVDDYLLFHEEYLDYVQPYIDKAVAQYKKVLIVSPRISGAQWVSDYLTSENIEHFLVYGAIKKREQLYKTPVLVATLDLVKEGFDIPALECIIVLSRRMHKLIVTQIVGRCERYLEGKKQPIVYFLMPTMKREREVVWRDIDLGKV